MLLRHGDLEDVLRDQSGDRQAVATVAKKIQRKLEWEADWTPAALEFLKAFYKAQRAHLERRMLVGQARERKK